MKLTQELLSKLNSPVEEGAFPPLYDKQGLAKFQKQMSIIEDAMDKIEGIIRNGGEFEALGDKLGGDQGLYKSALGHFSKFYDEMMDYHMSVGITQDEELHNDPGYSGHGDK
jgi:hypothetical protein